LGWAEITHPFHPRKGQRFQVVSVRRVRGVDSVALRRASGETFFVPREWTDRADPSPYSQLAIGPLLVDFEHLLAVVELLEAVMRSSRKGG
jgi:hypothetical protein